MDDDYVDSEEEEEEEEGELCFTAREKPHSNTVTATHSLHSGCRTLDNRLGIETSPKHKMAPTQGALE